MSKQSCYEIQSMTGNFLAIKSYYELCTQLLQIDEFSLRCFPASTPPYRETFQRLLSIKITQRQTRLQISLHLASAYYSTSQFQRQNYLHNHFFTFLSKLRQIPPNITLLLTLQKVRKPIQYAAAYLETHSHELIKNYIQINQEIISPQQIIQDCAYCVQTIQKTAKSSFGNKESSHIPETQKTTQKQDLQHFMNQKEFFLDQKLMKLIEWKYKGCIICSQFLLEKETKKITLNFIKFTKTLIKAGLIDIQIVVKVYIFCLDKAIKKKLTFNQISQEHVYFQLELNKILRSQNQLSQKLQQSIQSISNQIKLKTQQSLFQNPQRYQKSVVPDKSLIVSNNPKTKIKQKPHFPISENKAVQNGSFNHNQQTINKSRSRHGLSQHNQFFSRYKLRFNYLVESQSLNKIKQYQMSRRKQKNEQREGNKSLKSTITFRFQKQQKQSLSQNKLHTYRNLSQHQIQTSADKKDELSFKLKTIESQSTSNWRRKRLSKTPSKIYLTIKDKASKEVAITAMGLENEMFMAPEFVIEKPKITFKQILNDTRSFQQQQNDSQSTVFHHTVNETYLQKVETELVYMCIMNEQFYFLRIKKQPETAEHFTCSLWSSEYSAAVLKFGEEKQVTFKMIKNSIQSTDLFFQLMQANIKAFKLEPVLKLAMIIKNLVDLESSDQLTYFSHMACLNVMVQIANYIRPYTYWYFTKRNKINGIVLEKRQKLEMSDPLKFSINLEFFKKNDRLGCINLFQTVRNKKGLRQSLIYLSQGREILCKRLLKVNNKYFIQVTELNPKYLRRFQIGPSMELSFYALKLDLKNYEITEEVLSKERIIINKAFDKMFRKTLKKKSKRMEEENDNSQKINMKNIFSNDQCNRIIINNLNKNYIEKKYVMKLISYFNQLASTKKPAVCSSQNEQEVTKAHFQSTTSKEKIIYEKQDNCKLEVRLGLEPNPDKNDDSALALKFWATSIRESHASKRPSSLAPKPNPQNPDTFAEELTKNQLIMSQRIHKKLKNYNNFLMQVIQNYQSSFLVYVYKEYQKKFKLGGSFFSLSVLQLQSKNYILIINSNTNFKTWIFYLSQKLLRNFDYLTFKVVQQKQPELQLFPFIKSDEFNFGQQSNIRIKVKPVTSLQSHNNLIYSEPGKKQIQSDLSIRSKKSLEIYIKQQIKLNFFPHIFNDQSEKFQLCFNKTPFYNSIAIRRRHTDLYFTNRSSKNNIFSVSYSVNKIVMKKVTKFNPTGQSGKEYLYFACSLDEILNFWRIDLYRPSNQEKYVVIIPKDFFIMETSRSQRSKKQEYTKDKYCVFWKKIINEKKYKIDFFDKIFTLNSSEFKIYETFGRLTLPPTAFIQENYFQIIQNYRRKIYKTALEDIEKRNAEKKNHFSLSNNSGLAQLLKMGDQVILILVNYEKKKLFSSVIDENPTHIFENIFSEQKFKESKHFLYQSLFRRLFQKLQRNSIVLNSTCFDEFSFVKQ